MRGRCHCGAVTIEVPRAPERLVDCNCSLCRRYGVLWSYWGRDEVRAEGPTVAYAWNGRNVAFQHCPTCGCVTHWTALKPGKRTVGVNARMLDGFPFESAEVELRDRASR